MSDTIQRTLVEATEDLIAGASAWLTPEHAPAVAILRTLAPRLDSSPTAALASSYGLTYRDLLKRAPGASAAEDPLEKALRAAESA